MLCSCSILLFTFIIIQCVRISSINELGLIMRTDRFFNICTCGNCLFCFSLFIMFENDKYHYVLLYSPMYRVNNARSALANLSSRHCARV